MMSLNHIFCVTILVIPTLQKEYSEMDFKTGPPGMLWNYRICPKLGNNFGSLEVCKNKCLQTDTCTAFNFVPGWSNRCELLRCPVPVPEPTWNYGRGWIGYSRIPETVMKFKTGPAGMLWYYRICPKLGIRSRVSLEVCKKSCLETDRCTAFNFLPGRSNNCELLRCPVPVPEPTWNYGRGWRGYSRIPDVPVCSPQCVNGNCTVSNTCKCNPGWEGPQCQDDVPLCSPPCVNGACTASNTCKCKPGWEGTQCQDAVPECSPPCVNGSCTTSNPCKCNPQCQDVCSLKKDSGFGKVIHIYRYYYDMKLDRCMSFRYWGKGGNANRFESRHDCELRCRKSSACSIQEDPGTGNVDLTRYYYDPEHNACFNFTYHGEGGNGNRFLSIDECETTCKTVTDCPVYDGMEYIAGAGEYYKIYNYKAFDWHEADDLCTSHGLMMVEPTNTSIALEISYYIRSKYNSHIGFWGNAMQKRGDASNPFVWLNSKETIPLYSDVWAKDDGPGEKYACNAAQEGFTAKYDCCLELIRVDRTWPSEYHTPYISRECYFTYRAMCQCRGGSRDFGKVGRGP